MNGFSLVGPLFAAQFPYPLPAVSLAEGLVGLYKPFYFSFFSITGWGIDLDCYDIEWFALEMNRDHFQGKPLNITVI